MHPILARSSRLALYLGLWALVGGLLTALLAGRAGLTWPRAATIALPLASAYAFVCLSAWYVSRSMPLRTTSAPRILASGLVAAALSSAVWLALARAWTNLLVRQAFLPESARAAQGHGPLIFGFGVLLYLLSLAVSYLLGSFEETREVERRALKVQVLAREAELRSLRAQIDPHFLFNSLHSISALTTADPPAARRMCVVLAEFLRESLALEGEDRITVARELKLAERFLAVERVRFGSRLDMAIASEPAAEGCLIPPLLLQPLVENAVTHGVAHQLEGGTIRIAASRTPKTLSILIENPCDPDRPRGTGTGVGLANVRARLRALYGSEAAVHATEERGVWRVELSLPAVTASA